MTTLTIRILNLNKTRVTFCSHVPTIHDQAFRKFKMISKCRPSQRPKNNPFFASPSVDRHSASSLIVLHWRSSSENPRISIMAKSIRSKTRRKSRAEFRRTIGTVREPGSEERGDPNSYKTKLTSNFNLLRSTQYRCFLYFFLLPTGRLQ